MRRNRPQVSKFKEWAYGWHWRPYNGELKNGDGRSPRVGERLVAQVISPAGRRRRPVTNPDWCRPGFHAAPTLSTSLAFKSYGRRISFVLMGDAKFFHGKDKFVARTRTILWETTLPEELWRKLDRLYVGEAVTLLKAHLAREGFNLKNVQARARRLRKKFKG